MHSFLTSFALNESERLNAIKKAVTQLIERGVSGKLERTSVDPGAQRKEQSGFFLGGHYRDGNGRFRILSEGDTKSWRQLPYLSNGREKTIYEAEIEG